MEAKSYLASKIETTMVVLAQHLNHMDIRHGGEIMKLMDDTAGHVFIRHAEGEAVTAAANNIRFIKGIPHKSFVRCSAQLMSVGSTSMKVGVKVYIEDIRGGNQQLAAEGEFVGVAIDAVGSSRPVAPLLMGEID